MKKIHSQPRWSVNQPPSSGPATEETPKTAANIPWYLPRSRGGITSPMTARARDIRPPPPRPWTARPAIMTLIPGTLRKSAISGEKPQISEPIRKTTIAAWNIGRRPRMSEILPQSGVAAVEVSRYAVTTQESLSRPPNSEVMLGQSNTDDALVQGGKEHAGHQPAHARRESGDGSDSHRLGRGRCPVSRTSLSALRAPLLAALGTPILPRTLPRAARDAAQVLGHAFSTFWVRASTSAAKRVSSRSSSSRSRASHDSRHFSRRARRERSAASIFWAPGGLNFTRWARPSTGSGVRSIRPALSQLGNMAGNSGSIQVGACGEIGDA